MKMNASHAAPHQLLACFAGHGVIFQVGNGDVLLNPGQNMPVLVGVPDNTGQEYPASSPDLNVRAGTPIKLRGLPTIAPSGAMSAAMSTLTFRRGCDLL